MCTYLFSSKAETAVKSFLSKQLQTVSLSLMQFKHRPSKVTTFLWYFFWRVIGGTHVHFLLWSYIKNNYKWSTKQHLEASWYSAMHRAGKGWSCKYIFLFISEHLTATQEAWIETYKKKACKSASIKLVKSSAHFRNTCLPSLTTSVVSSLNVRLEMHQMIFWTVS